MRVKLTITIIVSLVALQATALDKVQKTSEPSGETVDFATKCHRAENWCMVMIGQEIGNSFRRRYYIWALQQISRRNFCDGLGTGLPYLLIDLYSHNWEVYVDEQVESDKDDKSAIHPFSMEPARSRAI